jgi:hypothetical protein
MLSAPHPRTRKMLFARLRMSCGRQGKQLCVRSSTEGFEFSINRQSGVSAGLLSDGLERAVVAGSSAKEDRCKSRAGRQHFEAAMRIAALICVAILFATCAISHSWGQAWGQVRARDREEAVRMVVDEFGKRLRSVAVLAPREVVVDAMEQAYSAYVAPELLATWKNNPEKAPGKRTSSPSPERIDISAIKNKGRDAYTVIGKVILLTAQERREGGVFQANPVTMIVARRHGKWLITAYEEIEALP